ncbi:hypothetical protein Pint_34872 [Pistacia integerrima]|uniref:Uncharacterized protein n=1 Tax=Pistacia integerrima TaxID=434235 RepID=A0ACC0Y389_9ROSI|nr:hypothetical protein Pint_34872 [Pistacia integerrima]
MMTLRRLVLIMEMMLQLIPAFQRFAVRTSRRIEDISSKAVQKRQELAEQMKDFSKNFESKNQ